MDFENVDLSGLMGFRESEEKALVVPDTAKNKTDKIKPLQSDKEEVDEQPPKNKATIQVTNSPTQFPSLPSQWAERFDVRIWNEMLSVCNLALAEFVPPTVNVLPEKEIAPPTDNVLPEKRRCTVPIVFTTIWIIFLIILASVLLVVYLAAPDEYCCGAIIYMKHKRCKYCKDYNTRIFISSMVFYGLAGTICLFVCPCVIYRDLYQQPTEPKPVYSEGTNKKRIRTKVMVSLWTIFFILANSFLGGFFGDEYCCEHSSYGTCMHYCKEYNWDLFISSMVFYALAGFMCFFVCPWVVYCDYYKKDAPQTSDNKSLEDIAQMHFNSLNEKYQNMIVFKIASVDLASGGCMCCSAWKHSFELEIEMKLQVITYIPDGCHTDGQTSLLSVQQPSTLPTQQQTSLLPTQAQTEIQPLQIATAPLPIEDQANNLNANQGFGQKDYTEWSTENVLNWIVQLDDGQFATYQQRLMETLNAEEIDGNDLCDLDKDDLHRLGIQ
eukprot:172395_1